MNHYDYDSLSDMDFILYLAKCYLAKSDDPIDLNKIKDEDLYPDTYHNDVGWFMVGRNSSHDFYLGMKDNKMFKRSTEIVEEYTIPEETYLRLVNSENVDDRYIAYENCQQVLKEHITEVTRDNLGYIGHW